MHKYILTRKISQTCCKIGHDRYPIIHHRGLGVASSYGREQPLVNPEVCAVPTPVILHPAERVQARSTPIAGTE